MGKPDPCGTARTGEGDAAWGSITSARPGRVPRGDTQPSPACTARGCSQQRGMPVKTAVVSNGPLQPPLVLRAVVRRVPASPRCAPSLASGLHPDPGTPSSPPLPLSRGQKAALGSGPKRLPGDLFLK